MSPKPFLLFWASTRAILEFISAREILESIYQTYFHENKTIYKKIDSNEFIKGGFPSLIMAGVVLLSQISLTISNCSYEKFPVNYKFTYLTVKLTDTAQKKRLIRMNR
eukprot:snap_masked-scaffold_37-processed-gene-1.26-mRNA-1 protein AED:1.00 eAED:1.00 QI:0/0/0/0/1/1/2/0/107